jgi:hypothetical protein
MEAVRQAMAKLGLDAGRADIQKYVKTNFGIGMHVDHISTCSAEIRRKRKRKRAKAAVGKAPATAAAPTVSKTPATPVTRSKIGDSKPAAGINMRDVLAVKDLVDRVGVSNLKTLVDAFTG